MSNKVAATNERKNKKHKITELVDKSTNDPQYSKETLGKMIGKGSRKVLHKHEAKKQKASQATNQRTAKNYDRGRRPAPEPEVKWQSHQPERKNPAASRQKSEQTKKQQPKSKEERTSQHHSRRRGPRPPPPPPTGGHQESGAGTDGNSKGKKQSNRQRRR
jgi:glucan-binding YG repeat protein